MLESIFFPFVRKSDQSWENPGINQAVCELAENFKKFVIWRKTHPNRFNVQTIILQHPIKCLPVGYFDHGFHQSR